MSAAARPSPMPGIGVLMSVVLLATACSTQSISLKPEILLPPSTAGEGASIRLSPDVGGVPDPVGRRTKTLLHLPAGKVVLDRGTESIVHGLRKALEATGYRVTSLLEGRDSPILVCSVTRMRFRSNDWAFPILFLSGEVELSLSLVDPRGRTLWQRRYRREHHEDGVEVSFERAVSRAFNKSLAAAMYDFESPEFRAICCSPDSSGRAAAR